MDPTPRDHLPIADFADAVAIPSRSHLYSLAPIGIGTAYAESLTSYITRLAEAYAVPVGDLLTMKLLPEIKRVYHARSGRLVFIRESARSINSTGAGAAEWERAVKKLTGRNDLQSTTWLPWRNVISPKGLLKLNRAWCPACYQEWLDAGSNVYEPLLWAVRLVAVCPKHNQELQQVCPNPNCRRQQHPLAQRARAGHCPHCGRWLGLALGRQTTNGRIASDHNLDQLGEVANAVGELIAAAPSVRTADNHTIAKTIRGGWSVLKRAARQTANEESRHALKTILGIALALGISPLDLLSGNPKPYGFVSAGTTREASVSRRHRRTAGLVAMDKKQARRALEAELVKHSGPQLPVAQLAKLHNVSEKNMRNWFPEQCRLIGVRYQAGRKQKHAAHRQALEAAVAAEAGQSPSVAEMARRLGVCTDQLTRPYPELCRIIGARYLEDQKARKRERISRSCQEVRKVVANLVLKGEYPSQRKVGRLVSNAAILLDKEVQRERKETMQQLGVIPLVNHSAGT